MIQGYLTPQKPKFPTISKVDNKMFNSMFKKSLGKKIWTYLCKDITIIRMIDAANLRKPSLEPISIDIDKEFDLSGMNESEQKKWKQYIGYMIKIIMEKNSYIHDVRDIRINFDKEFNLFKKASRYKKFIL